MGSRGRNTASGSGRGGVSPRPAGRRLRRPGRREGRPAAALAPQGARCPADLARLRDAPAGQVDAVLRQVLGAHQQAAADLAWAHLETATSPRVRELARRIEQSRTAEVRLMAAPAVSGR
ncbi:DUF305 domain-containing protein [Micromonospora sp. NPDC047548]|uniref:DUF305 domain-containing protein n=1 Tax=Micromonospora sp. NPDC047548 TaxID=3155624 RepID=UPI0033DD5549